MEVNVRRTWQLICLEVFEIVPYQTEVEDPHQGSTSLSLVFANVCGSRAGTGVSSGQAK